MDTFKDARPFESLVADFNTQRKSGVGHDKIFENLSAENICSPFVASRKLQMLSPRGNGEEPGNDDSTQEKKKGTPDNENSRRGRIRSTEESTSGKSFRSIRYSTYQNQRSSQMFTLDEGNAGHDQHRSLAHNQIENELHTLINGAMRNFFYLSRGFFEVIHLVQDRLEKVVLQAGETLIEEGEDGHNMFFVQEGTLSVYRDGTVVGGVKAGDVVGELALLYNEKRSATVKTESTCILWSLSRTAFHSIQATQSAQSRYSTYQKLRAVPCFESLNGYTLKKLMTVMSKSTFRDGEDILNTNEKTGTCLLLEHGKVIISRDEDINSNGGMGAVQDDWESDPHCSVNDHGLLVAHPGCFLGRPVINGAAGLPDGGDPFDQESRTVTSSTTFKAYGSVVCRAFTLKEFETAIGPVESVVKGYVQDMFGSLTDDQRPEIPDLFVDDFEHTAFLGSGAFGLVTLATCVKPGTVVTGNEYAIKAMSKVQIITNNHCKQVQHEKEILQMFHHPFILRMVTTMQDADSLYLVTDYIPSIALFDLLYVNPPPTRVKPMLNRYWAAIIAESIAHFHAHGVAYRDLKPENILIDATSYITVIDAGLAKVIPYTSVVDGEEILQDRTYTLCGTIEYLAPEFFAGHGYNHAVDYWALGCLIYEMAVGRTPFTTVSGDKNYSNIIKHIWNTRYVPIRLPETFRHQTHLDGVKPNAAVALTRGLLRANPSERLGNLASGAKELIEHAYFEGIDWEKLLKKEIELPWVPPLMEPKLTGPNNSSIEKVAPHASYLGDQSLFESW